jgi:predicted amidohydrolase
MRKLITAAAQMGPIAKSETRADTVGRLLEMMREAKGRGCELVVFTELALTTFFPRQETWDRFLYWLCRTDH